MKYLVILGLSVPLVLAFYFMSFGTFESTDSAPFERVISIDSLRAQSDPLPVEEPYPTRPEADQVKAVHLSYAFYNSERYEAVLAEIENSEINSIIFEIKDPLGRVLVFDKKARETLATVIDDLHRRGIYTIARMVLFQDPALVASRPELGIQNYRTGAPWQDYKGIVWADPTSREVWEYNVRVVVLAVSLGFDEINFDYIRFPTDGPLDEATYAHLDDFGTREKAIASFLAFVRDEVGDEIMLSIDVFGMTFINDQGVIGQVLTELAPFVDVIAPMPYPSHYPSGFLGYTEPADFPYEIISYTLARGIVKLAGFEVIIRPWLQDFDLGAVYDEEKIRAQIQATNDAALDTWFLWNASNRYTFSAVRGTDNRTLDK